MTDDPPDDARPDDDGARSRWTDGVGGPAYFERRLKQVLLPDHLPALPEVDLGAAHLSAQRDLVAGGDWHDVVVREDGTVVLVVGDVAGWGVTATVAGAELRAIVHERLCGGAGIADALLAADAHARCTDRITSATMSLVELDPHTGSASYCTAGHPPPLVWSAHDGARFLPVTGGTPLATAGSFPVSTTRLEPDEVVVLYSDGLLEGPARDPATSTVELVGVVDEVARRRFGGGGEEPVVEGLASTTIEVVAQNAGHTDDITVLAAQRRERMRRLTLDLPAEPGTPRACRDQLLAWLQPLRPSGFDVAAAEHVVDELVRNVVQHAYLDPRHDTHGVRLDVEWDRRGSLVIAVSDAGAWREPGEHGGGGLGHGLALVAELAEALDVHPGEDGSTVVVRMQLHRPTAILDPRPPRAETPEPLRIHWDDATRTVQVIGAVDVDAAERLRILLVRSTAGGSRSATLDLTGVTHLCAAAVKVLFDTVHAPHGAGVRLVAPPGSAAHLVLDRVALLPVAVQA